LWRTRTLWGILLIRFITDPVWYFCIFWFPGYLQENSGLSLKNIGMLGWIPFVIADIGGIVSAVWSDWMVKRGVETIAGPQNHAYNHGCSGSGLYFNPTFAVSRSNTSNI
jgi:hypothetical protein